VNRWWSSAAQFTILAIVVIALLTAFFDKQPQSRKTWCYSEFIHRITQQEVRQVSVSSDQTVALATTKDNRKVIVNMPVDSELFNLLIQNNVEISILPETDEGFWFKALSSLFFPIMLLIGLFLIFRSKFKDNEQPIRPYVKESEHLRQSPNKKTKFYTLLLTLLVILTIYLLILFNIYSSNDNIASMLFGTEQEQSQKIKERYWSYSDLIQTVKNHKVDRIYIDTNLGTAKIISKDNNAIVRMPKDTKTYVDFLMKNGVSICVQSQGTNKYLMGFLINMMWILPLIGLFFLFW
jgi:ATP-dependent Zn protease